MSDAQVESLLKRYYVEVWLEGTISALDSLLADDYLDHNPLPGFGADKSSAKAMAAAYTSGRRDQAFDELEILVREDRAAAHWRLHWTNTADGKVLHLRGHDFYRLRDGRIAEIWHCEDIAGLRAQMAEGTTQVEATLHSAT
jgi:ketosteroid isomerase-like protein